MKTMLILFFCAFIFNPRAEATAKKKTHPKAHPTKVRKEMNTISGLVREMGLFIASEPEFLRDSNKTIIQKNLEELTRIFKNLKVHPVIEMQGLAVNQAVMADQLEETVVLFKNNRKAMARAKFNSALNLCVSCHTQSPGTLKKEDSKIFADKDIQKFKINDFEKAELYFITRDFDKAVNLYDKFIRASWKTDDDEYIYKALERQLIYFVKIKKDFPAAKAHFEAYLKEKKLNEKIANEVGEWVKTLSGKGLWDQFDPAKTKEEDMEKFMKTFIADDEEGPIFSLTNSSEVNDLNLSSILMDYYNAHPETKLGAKILFWLANIDRRVSDDLFFSLGDYYLMNCMEKYPKDPIAKECYESYVDDLEINYLGKDKDFTPDIKARLKRLQKLLNYQEQDQE